MVERKLAAILAADVAGYSRLMGDDEEGTLNALRNCRTELIDPLVAEHGGRIVKAMGDGLLIEFPSVVEAVRCSIEIQKGMCARNVDTPPNRRIEFRIGINVGDVIVEGDDIFGDGVNIAARLEGISDPGGICISEAALDQVRGRIKISADDMGQRSLKNIESPVRAFRISEAIAPAAKPHDDVQTVHENLVSFPSERPSLAILPFRNFSPSRDADYIADGISLGIQTLLVQLPNMFFVNACRHEGYRREEVSASEALSHLPIRYAVEGWVQQAGNRVRVSVQVSDLKNSVAIWADKYDRELSDIFDLQDEIARRIAAALSVELIGGHLARDFTGGLGGPGDWENFLRGINHFYRMTKQDFAQAIPHFEALAKAHPDSAIGPCYLSVIHLYAAKRNWSVCDGDALEQAEKWARQAIQLQDGNNGLGHAVLGAIELDRKKHDESLRLCRTAVGYRASCPFAHGQLGISQTYSGDPASGIKQLREAISVRLAGPSPLELNALAVAYRDHGDVDLSIPTASEAARLDAGFLDAYVTLCIDLEMSGDTDRAREIAKQITAMAPDFSTHAYLAKLPYRDKAMLQRIDAAMNDAGLPQ
jgi:class 3 adenylate cyclase/TolB-like protein